MRVLFFDVHPSLPRSEDHTGLVNNQRSIASRLSCELHMQVLHLLLKLLDEQDMSTAELETIIVSQLLACETASAICLLFVSSVYSQCGY